MVGMKPLISLHSFKDGNSTFQGPGRQVRINMQKANFMTGISLTSVKLLKVLRWSLL